MCVCVAFLASHFSDFSRCISKFTGWVIIEELSIRRRLPTFLISRGQKMCVKHCHSDLSSWYAFWFAILCLDMNVILDPSTTIQQFQRRFRLPDGQTQRIFFYWNTMTGNNSSTDGSLLRKNVKIKCKEYISRLLVGVKSNTVVLRVVPWLRNHLGLPLMPAHSRQPERQNIIDRMHTWQQCSVTISEDILTKYGFILR